MKQYEVKIAFDIYEVGTTINDKMLKSKDYSTLDLLSGCVIESIENDIQEPMFFVGEDKDSKEVLYIRVGKSQYLRNSVVLSFEALMNSEEFIPIADEDQLNTYRQEVSLDQQKILSIKDIEWALESNPENNNSPFSQKMNDGFRAMIHLLLITNKFQP